MGYGHLVGSPNTHTITYEEIASEGSGGEVGPIETMGSNMRATRLLKCKYSDRLALASGLLGTVNWRTGAIAMMLPEQYPYGSTRLPLFAKEIRIRPYGDPNYSYGANGTLGWEHALLEVTYLPPQGYDNSGVLWKEEYTPTSEFIVASGGKLYWNVDATDEVDESARPGVTIRKAEWVINWQKVPTNWYDFVPGIHDYIGKINSADVYSDSFGVTFDGGTLLYNGPHFERDRFSDGSAAVHVSLHFQYQSQTWNKFPKADALDANGNMAFQTIYVSSTVPFLPYKSADHNVILPWNL